MFEELLEKINKNSVEEKKVNVHFFLNKDLSKICIEINRKLRKKYGESSLVNFSNTDIIYPHVTMSMGYYRNPEELRKLLAQIEQISSEFSEVILKPKGIEYLSFSKYSLKYLSLFFEEEKQLKIFKKNIHTKLESNYSSKLEWNILEARPHVTLGVLKEELPYKDIIEGLEFSELKIDRIGISIAGSRGTCLGTIKDYYLNGK